MNCPACGTDSDGAFCPKCGVPLRGATCEVCEAALQPGASFCTQCGAPVREPHSALPWIVSGIALAALILVLALPTIRPDGPGDAILSMNGFGSAGAPAMPSSPQGTPPPLTGTPREQADRLFNRIMEEREKGNNEGAQFFLPMGISAYRQAGELDADGLYHLSVLESAAGQGPAARATAERVLAASPTHLLGLAAAAEASVQMGDSAAARDFYRRFLENFDQENAKQLPEYLDHARVLPEYRRSAEALLAGGA
jgi:hypothetical protein